jgi:hypothetical protein
MGTKFPEKSSAKRKSKRSLPVLIGEDNVAYLVLHPKLKTNRLSNKIISFILRKI